MITTGRRRISSICIVVVVPPHDEPFPSPHSQRHDCRREGVHRRTETCGAHIRSQSRGPKRAERTYNLRKHPCSVSKAEDACTDKAGKAPTAPPTRVHESRIEESDTTRSATLA